MSLTFDEIEDPNRNIENEPPMPQWNKHISLERYATQELAKYEDDQGSGTDFSSKFRTSNGSQFQK